MSSVNDVKKLREFLKPSLQLYESSRTMESRWYLAPGQTLAQTKIKDRGHALHATKKAWGKITAHLDRKRLIAEAIEKDHAHRKSMKEGSEAMTKHWDNSVENLRKRKEENRKVNLTKTKEDQLNNFLELRKEQEEIRKKYVEEVRKSMYMSSGYPKTLNSALLFSEILYEREKQKEFDKTLKQHELEEDQKYAQKVKEEAQQEIIDKLNEKKNAIDKKLQLKEMYLKQMEDAEELEKAQRKLQRDAEVIDNINAEKEMKQMKQVEFEEEMKKRSRVKTMLTNFLAQQQEFKDQEKKEEEEQDKCIQIYSEAKHRIDCLKKQKAKEIQDSMIERRLAASKQAAIEQKAKTDEEEQRIRAAMAEKDRLEEEKRLARIEYDKKMKQQRIDNREAYLLREENEKRKLEEIKKWELLNRCKTEDVMKQYKLENKKRHWQDILKYRKELFEQMAETQEELRKEREEDTVGAAGILAKYDKDDKRFFEYAEEVLQLAKSKDRSTLPIERVIEQYKKDNNLGGASSGRKCLHKAEECTSKKELVNKTPGQLAHNPKSDPTYKRCKSHKGKLYR